MRVKLKPKMAFLSVAFVVLVLASSTANSAAFGFSLPQLPYAEWRDGGNGQEYLYVKAYDRYTLGYLEGKYLADKIVTLKGVIDALSDEMVGLPYEVMLVIAQAYKPYIPAEYRAELTGMRDGVNSIYGLGTVSYDDLVLQNTLTDILYGLLIPLEANLQDIGVMACTAFGAYNNGNPIISQNFDFEPHFEPTLAYVEVDYNGVKTFSLRSGSTLAIPVGMNSYGVMTTTNVVSTKDPALFIMQNILGYEVPVPIGGEPYTIVARYALEHAETAQQYGELMTSCDTMSYNVMFADDDTLMQAERAPHYLWMTSITDVFVHSNTYVNPDAQGLLASDYSKDRQAYAEQRLNDANSDGYVSESELLDIMADYPIIYRSPFDGQSCTLAAFTPYHFGINDVQANFIDPINNGQDPIYISLGATPSL